jgi:hypothetical protein
VVSYRGEYISYIAALQNASRLKALVNKLVRWIGAELAKNQITNEQVKGDLNLKGTGWFRNS